MGQPTRLEDLPYDGAALETLYREGRRPARLVGRFRGRLFPLWLPSPLVRRVPWEGKVLSDGVGRNRLVGFGERFTFDVRDRTSVLDGRPCTVFDYGRPGNPPGVRRLVDELREIAPELHLGPGLGGRAGACGCGPGSRWRRSGAGSACRSGCAQRSRTASRTR